jgi:hypothetical protein
VYDDQTKIVGSNDNWNEQRAALLANGLAPTVENEAGLVLTLAPGSYTVVVSGAGMTSGVALVEVYDLTPDSDSSLANISTRGNVQADDNVMIGGFIIAPDMATKVLIRAIGPSLGQYGVIGALADPVLELHDGEGNLVVENDNWRSTQPAAIIATGIPPADNRESAILATLEPGSYTAIVRGQNNTTGVALIEVYNLDAGSSETK